MKPTTVSAGQAREGRVVRYYLLIRSIVERRRTLRRLRGVQMFQFETETRSLQRVVARRGPGLHGWPHGIRVQRLHVRTSAVAGNSNLISLAMYAGVAILIGRRGVCIQGHRGSDQALHRATIGTC
jgi:hypothetical protein